LDEPGIRLKRAVDWAIRDILREAARTDTHLYTDLRVVLRLSTFDRADEVDRRDRAARGKFPRLTDEWEVEGTRMAAGSHGQRIIALLENAIRTRELALISMLAAGEDGTIAEAAIIDLYRTLQIAHQFQTHGTKQSSTWLMDFP
jgi:hypothetical protein